MFILYPHSFLSTILPTIFLKFTCSVVLSTFSNLKSVYCFSMYPVTINFVLLTLEYLHSPCSWREWHRSTIRRTATFSTPIRRSAHGQCEFPPSYWRSRSLRPLQGWKQIGKFRKSNIHAEVCCRGTFDVLQNVQYFTEFSLTIYIKYRHWFAQIIPCNHWNVILKEI